MWPCSKLTQPSRVPCRALAQEVALLCCSTTGAHTDTLSGLEFCLTEQCQSVIGKWQSHGWTSMLVLGMFAATISIVSAGVHSFQCLCALDFRPPGECGDGMMFVNCGLTSLHNQHACWTSLLPVAAPLLVQASSCT